MLWAANTSLALNFQTAREYKPKDAGMNDASWLFPPLFAAPGRCPWIPAFFFRHRHLHGKSGPNAPSRAPTKWSPLASGLLALAAARSLIRCRQGHRPVAPGIKTASRKLEAALFCLSRKRVWVAGMYKNMMD